MDYEQKYKSMLELARDYHSRCQTEEAKIELEAIFPELHESESEDERIRKELVQFLTDVKNISEDGRHSWQVRKEDAEMCTRFLAYLEKQKEQKPADDNPLDDSRFTEGFDAGRSVQKIFDEPKHAEWSEEDENMVWNIISIVGQSNSLRQDAMVAWLKSLREKICV